MDGKHRKDGTFRILDLAVFLYFLSLFRCHSGCAESAVIERKIRNTSVKMSGKCVDICRRKKPEICTDIQKHGRSKMGYLIFCIYKIVYEMACDCQGRSCILNTKKVRNLRRNHSSFFVSNRSKKAGILHGVLFASGETTLCLD